LSETSRAFYVSDARPFFGSDIPPNESQPHQLFLRVFVLLSRSVPWHAQLRTFPVRNIASELYERCMSKRLYPQSRTIFVSEQATLRPWADVLCLSQYRECLSSDIVNGVFPSPRIGQGEGVCGMLFSSAHADGLWAYRSCDLGRRIY
jgi:hypothetical protein